MNIQLVGKIVFTSVLLFVIHKTPVFFEEAGLYLNIPETQQQQQEVLEESINRGRTVYNDFCVQCHLPDGKGTEGVFPPLADSDWLMEKRTESIHSVKYGLKGEIVVNDIQYNNMMPPMGLLDREVADVMNYIMNSWGNTQHKMVTLEEVKSINK
ncbi:c-type cytochrome [Planktosalinus lacus]|uniref:Cytochrome c domain-containing protein n=1 Tax=Planktosalinus lacus TaxID=1526573 RepID=A0A8J2Y8N8_9FLAO|nr:cytochrome c [Planktosalinus lacus]GGD84337.1 hypothetical protein GCM10011312_05440 [Planktosalinus lacus]